MSGGEGVVRTFRVRVCGWRVNKREKGGGPWYWAWVVLTWAKGRWAELVF